MFLSNDNGALQTQMNSSSSNPSTSVHANSQISMHQQQLGQSQRMALQQQPYSIQVRHLLHALCSALLCSHSIVPLYSGIVLHIRYCMACSFCFGLSALFSILLGNLNGFHDKQLCAVYV
jgi:hypothetical protein